MINTFPTGAARVAGLVGQPIYHSLSPFLHNAWLRDLGLNGVYAPFSPKDEHAFERFIQSCRTNGIKGLNITAPFKELALKLSDSYSDVARAGSSANLLTFDEDGRIHADSTDGLGLIKAFALQAPDCDLTQPIAIMGAGGAARAVIAALRAAGADDIRIINRTVARAEELVFDFKSGVSAFDVTQIERAFDGVSAIINAASGGPLPLFDKAPDYATVMDMTYRPLKTAWLQAGAARGLKTVDGLGMLIEQARPSFEAFYGVLPRADYDMRALTLTFLGEA